MKRWKREVTVPSHKLKTALINPQYDPSQTYVSRLERPEWVAVGMMGKLLVRDDGTCRENGYCIPNAEGAATEAIERYRVLERTEPNQIRIVVK
ncbi:peptidase G2 autoproteolytic cleavage domain-containing protein [Paenibacillus taichungensis]|uniref:peptidase G2 autoproteolytic cleavage domain-containing protein n=1 Tax=Paenibacillus taichungensis TaxID=484184 RepID=UPI0035D906C5